ncbi:unnamed protein product [Allacma fusca]|uniref:Uncharacterized protein n=1 Tax=Allacma fusca TaxID=39272 RepID=A0A8J2K6K4_9HEXA|nr:unnamed protein product [Allacma fusca]
MRLFIFVSATFLLRLLQRIWDGHNNNGYVPYVDYTRDYNPPLGRNSVYSGGILGGGGGHSPQYLNNVDPRYSATYGNPYLRTSNTSLPPPHVGGTNHSPTGGGIIHNNTLNHNHSSSNNHHPHPHPVPPAPHHSIPFALRNGAVPQVARTPSTPSPHTTGTVPPPQYIVPSPTQLKPGTLATHV